MNERRDTAHPALKRLLANGRLTTVPKRPADSGLLTRTKSGSVYQVNVERLGEIEAMRGIDPAEVLAQVRTERDLRKRQQCRS